MAAGEWAETKSERKVGTVVEVEHIVRVKVDVDVLNPEIPKAIAESLTTAAKAFADSFRFKFNGT